MFGTFKFVTTRTVSQYGVASVRDLGLLCRNKMLRPVAIMVVSGTRSVFLMSAISFTFGQFRLDSARPGNNFFTDRHRAAVPVLEQFLKSF